MWRHTRRLVTRGNGLAFSPEPAPPPKASVRQSHLPHDWNKPRPRAAAGRSQPRCSHHHPPGITHVPGDRKMGHKPRDSHTWNSALQTYQSCTRWVCPNESASDGRKLSEALSKHGTLFITLDTTEIQTPGSEENKSSTKLYRKKGTR